MISVSIIGSGALSRSLFAAMSSLPSIAFQGVFGRNIDDATHFGTYWITQWEKVLQRDLILLAVPDDSIMALYERLDRFKGMVAHCSGITPLIQRTVGDSGVFYPLNSFNKSLATELKSTPFFIEASSEEGQTVLEQIAKALSPKVIPLSSDSRAKLHLAAVISQNFSNHMYALSERYCSEQGLDFEWIKPMLKGSLIRTLQSNAVETQSGPAKRNDLKTLEKHRALLKDRLTLLELYNSMTTSIQQLYEKEL